MNAVWRAEKAGDTPTEREFLDWLQDCHDRARAAMANQDWARLSEVALELDRLAGELNRAVAVGFTSPQVDVRLQALIGFLHKALAQARSMDTALRQKEVDLRRERSDIVTRSARRQDGHDSSD